MSDKYNIKAEKPDDIRKKYVLKIEPYRDLNKDFFKVCRGIFILKDSKAIHLYLYLCSCYNHKEGKCFPSYETIQKSTGLDRNTISKKLQILKKLNLIQIQKRKTGTNWNNIYVINYIYEIIERVIINDKVDTEQKLDLDGDIKTIEDVDIEAEKLENDEEEE